MKRYSTAPLAVAMVAGLACLPTLQAQTMHGAHTRHIILTPRQIKWVNAPPALPKGARIAVLEGNLGKPGPLTLRIRFPAHYRIAPHSHPDTERITILSGELHLGTGATFNKSRTVVLPAGSYTVLPKGGHHFVWTDRETIVQTNGLGPWGIKYLHPKDDPGNQS